jgi:2-polyprenyl-3-methyl-5-hydroxy-6-metoxy-1,4-benzoquinol methylase
MEIPVKPLQSLEAQRLHAAQASGGTSLDVIYDRILEIIQECDLRGRALDYGAGIGNLTRRLWASRRFEQITGADILPRPQDLPSAIVWYCLDLNHENAVPAASFDAVIAAEVIEHLENPREVARDFYEALTSSRLARSFLVWPSRHRQVPVKLTLNNAVLAIRRVKVFPLKTFSVKS